MNPYFKPHGFLTSHSPMAPPAGFRHNFHDPSVDGSLSASTIATVACLGALTTVLVLLRIYTRAFVTKCLGWDDYVSIGALAGALAHMSVTIYGYTYGLGVHEWNITYYKMIQLVPVFSTLDYLHGFVLFAAKLSICITLYRIFALMPYMAWAIYVAVAYNFLLHGVGTIVMAAICVPGNGAKYWGCAYKVSKLHIWREGFNIPSDFFLLLLPILAISRLQMPRWRKIGLVAIFLTGFL